MDLSILQFTCIGAAAFLVGFTKTSVGGVGILALNLTFLPVILIRAILGYKVLKYINIRLFGLFIRTAVLLAAIRLIAF